MDVVAPDAAAPTQTFVDQYGTAHPLDFSLRDRLKPAWRTMVEPQERLRLPDAAALATRNAAALASVLEARRIVETVSGKRLEGRVLEVGCYDGAAAFALAMQGRTTVVASDMARYYVVQRPGEPSDKQIAAEQLALASLRDATRVAAGATGGVVEFIEDDITASALPASSFDAIVSFEVLEHVQDPKATFKAMHRLLKPGGIGYHDYNPFFTLIGGHSLCTLDFPWGHARLGQDDFDRYVRELRPSAADQTLRFFNESLNRMTLADMRVSVDQAGLDIVAIIPWADRTLVGQLSEQALVEVQRNYPSATAEDLLATFVSVVVRRPA